MKIAWMSLDWSSITDELGQLTPGGAGWYRMVMPAKWVNDLSEHECVVGTSLSQKPSGELCLQRLDQSWEDGFDVMVIQRWMDDHAADAIRKARACGQLIIQDIDDWYMGLSPKNAAFWSSHPKVSPKANRLHYQKAIAASSGIFVSTPFLKSKYEHMAPTRVVRNAIDLELFERTRLFDDPEMTLGWVGATTHRSGDLETLRGIVPRFLIEHDVPFFHGGSERTDMDARVMLGIDDTKVRCKGMPMQAIRNYPRLFRRFNVGICPLADIPFNESKSGIKLLECSAASIPAICSDLPDYRWLHDKYGIGYIARRARNWQSGLNLYLDVDKRQEAGLLARQNVEAFDIRLRCHHWVEALEAIAREQKARAA